MHKKKYIFLSYSRKDNDFAIQLKDDLQKRGFEVWVDQKKISGGEVWRKSIADALADSHTVVWVVSPDSVNSKYVNKELSFADGKDVRIIPVMYKKAEIPFPYHELQFVDVSAEYINSSLDEIVNSINNLKTQIPKYRQGILKNSFLSILNGLEKLLYTAMAVFVVGGGFYFWHLASQKSVEVPKIKDKVIEQTKVVNNTNKPKIVTPTKTKPVVILAPKEDIKEIKKVEVKKITVPIKVIDKKHISKVKWKQITKDKLSQRDAIDTCKRYKDGWKLASLDELKFLAKDKESVVEIKNKNEFAYDFWSSTVSKKDKIKAYLFRFYDNSKNRVDINEKFNFLCIKQND